MSQSPWKHAGPDALPRLFARLRCWPGPCLTTRSMRQEADATRRLVKTSIDALLTSQSVQGLAHGSVVTEVRASRQLDDGDRAPQHNELGLVIAQSTIRRAPAQLRHLHIVHMHSESARGRFRRTLRREHMLRGGCHHHFSRGVMHNAHGSDLSAPLRVPFRRGFCRQVR